MRQTVIIHLNRVVLYVFQVSNHFCLYAKTVFHCNSKIRFSEKSYYQIRNMQEKTDENETLIPQIPKECKPLGEFPHEMFFLITIYRNHFSTIIDFRFGIFIIKIVFFLTYDITFLKENAFNILF